MPSKTKRNERRFMPVLYALTLACALILGTASVIGATGNGSNWRVMVKSAACVQGPDVLLGEIADPLDGLDERTWKTVSAIKLWKASEKQGRPISIDRKKLREVLQYYLGEMVKNVVLPSQLTVQTRGRVIPGSELRSRVVAFLTPRAKELGGHADFKDLRLPMNFFFPNEYDKLAITLASDIKPGRNQIRLRRISSDGRVLAGKAGTVFINVWKAVPVAVRPLNRNERVTKEKITFKRVNLAYNQNLWDGTGGPWRMARTLGTGQPFSQSHLEQIPLIEKGEKVSLIYRNKRIQLTIKAEALGEASIGQQVSVRNLQSQKTIVATVVGDNMVMTR